MVGSLFIRSYERAERVGQAMVARGYDGSMRMLSPLRRLRLADGALLGALAVLLAAIRIA
jgi:cobalt/nickel transport system permease protein